jgi:hypothetical protein
MSRPELSLVELDTWKSWIAQARWTLNQLDTGRRNVATKVQDLTAWLNDLSSFAIKRNDIQDARPSQLRFEADSWAAQFRWWRVPEHRRRSLKGTALEALRISE